ncbi:MAG: hypothetical protein PHN82_01405 [bacterium]|nr:hypothetical protein [bacterium]
MQYDILHEDCVKDRSYIVDIEGKRFEACFKGYPDGDQYSPVFEIRDAAGSVKVIRQCGER